MKNKKTKILAIHQGFELYGSDRSFLSSLEAMKKDSLDIIIKVIIPQYGSIVNELNKIVDDLVIEDIGSVTTSYAKKHPFKSIVKIIKNAFLAKKHINNSDLIYVNTIVPFGYILAGFFTFKPFIIHVREIPSKNLSLIFSFWFRISRFYILYNSYATKKVFQFDNAKKSLVLWNGVNNLTIDKSKISNDGLIHLLIIGRLNRWKGQMFFLEAFTNLSNDIKSKFKVYIVGDSPKNQNEYKEKLIDYIQTENLTQYIELFGFDKKPEKYYTWADVVIVPSTQPEPFGRIAIEAMSIGKTVIAANHGGLAEIVIDKETGLLFEANNSKSLTDILISLLEVKNIDSQFYKNSLIRYTNNFTLTAYQNKFMNFLMDKIR